MKKSTLKTALLGVIAVVALSTSMVAAANTSKSVNQLSKLSEKDLLALIKSGCTNITYNGPNVVGTLCPVSTPAPEPTPTPTPEPTPTPKPNPSAERPSDFLDLTNWYLGLPVNTAHEGNPDNIYQPELTGYENRPYFFLNDAKDGVVFAANAGGATTSGSSYPRSELRERNGNTMAAWTNKSGTHTMEIRQAITKTTPVKPHVVAGQIHDGDDDVIQIRLEGKELAVHYNDGDSKVVLDSNYQLGAIFDVKVVAAGSRVKVSYNGVQKADLGKSGSGWYFKAGCYTQSNTSKGDAANAFGEVVIYALKVTHQ